MPSDEEFAGRCDEGVGVAMYTMDAQRAGPRMTPEECLEKLGRLTVRTTSSDGTVRVALDMTGTRLAFDGRGTHGHNEKTPAEPIGADLTVSQHGCQRAITNPIQRAATPPGPIGAFEIDRRGGLDGRTT